MMDPVREQHLLFFRRHTGLGPEGQKLFFLQKSSVFFDRKSCVLTSRVRHVVGK